jgi:hypothetical protein
LAACLLLNAIEPQRAALGMGTTHSFYFRAVCQHTDTTTETKCDLIRDLR